MGMHELLAWIGAEDEFCGVSYENQLFKKTSYYRADDKNQFIHGTADPVYRQYYCSS